MIPRLTAVFAEGDGLLEQSRQVLCESVRKNLDAYLAIRPGIMSAIHLAHPAGPQGRYDLIRAEFVACGKWHVTDPAKCSRSENK
jgi:hypothetical protein